jgi:adenylate cyclase
VEIQKELGRRNEELPEHRKMEFRIGVNLGDVIEEDETIYGDGVNIAARLESLAEGGGICISGTAFDQIRKRLSVGYEYLGEQAVKNIETPVRVYRVLIEPEAAGKVIGEERPKPKHWRWAAIGGVAVLIILAGALAIWNFYLRPPFEPASVERMALPLPEKPSIAVLPFDNLSGDPEQEYIADGMTENIISALSKISEMFVIARNSTFVYKGKSVKVQQVAEELGVRHILEGSVQKSDNRVRVTAQLIDALSGHHTWSEQYDRDMIDLFALQDEITKEIVVALQVKLTRGEQARVRHKTTDNIQAWGYVVKAQSLFEHYTKGDNAKARQLFEQAVQLDPNYAFAWTMLAWTHFIDVRAGFSKAPSESLKRAIELAKKASSLDDTLPDVHSLWNGIYLIQRHYDKAIAEGEKAITLGPNNALDHVLQAQTMRYAGRFEEAVVLAEKAIRLSPYYPAWYLVVLGASYRMAGRLDEALAVYMKLLERSKKGEYNVWSAHGHLAGVYADLGREQEARAHVAELLRINPNFSLQYLNKVTFYKDPAHLKRGKDALRKAGVPETPPLPLPDKPSIAVLPFVNMSGDPEQEYFSDGITEEIITALSKTPKLFVIARNSTFTYKGKPVKVQQVGRELGVKYVLEGSVRKADNKVRITAQLVDAKTGHHLWAERYDRELKDLFALQDEITKEIITALQVKLTEAEEARVLAKGTDNLEAYLKLLQGREHVHRLNKEDNAQGRQLINEAIALDPQYASAYTYLAGTHHLDAWLGSSKSPRESTAKAIELAQKAIALDDSLAEAHGLLGYLYTMTRQHDKGIVKAERGVALDPNSASALAWLGQNLYWADRPEEAIPVLKKAIRLNPVPPSWYLFTLAMAYRDTGRYEEAISACKKALHREPKDVITRLVLTATYGLSGREEEARSAAEEVLRIDPKFSLDRLARTRPHKNQANTKSYIDSLRKAGLK